MSKPRGFQADTSTLQSSQPLDPAEVRTQVGKILASPVFARAEQLRRFLSFTVEETLAGSGARLKEYTIGLAVFERNSSYDPRIDPVVRVQARRLRTKLEEYYANGGRDDPLLIEFIRGSYVPVFSRSTAPVLPQVEKQPLESTWSVRWRQTFAAGRVIWLLGLLALFGAAAIFRNRYAAMGGREVSPSVLKQLTFETGLTADPALSHDGRLLAYASDKDGHDRIEIWLQQTDGSASLQLTHDGANSREPSFSPDGTQIAYSSDREGGGIFIVPALGGECRLLARNGREPRFSPDGRWIAYWTGERHTARMGGRRVWIVPAAGGAPQEVRSSLTGMTHLGASFPRWLADGRHLMVYGWDGKGLPDWYILPFEGGDPLPTGLLRQVFPAHGLSLPSQNAAANLAVDGDSLVFSARYGDSTSLWRIGLNPQSGQPRGGPDRLTFGTARDLSPAVGGGRVVFSNSTLDSDIWMLPFDSGNGQLLGKPQKLVEHPALDQAPSTSETGDQVVFQSDRHGIPELWLHDSRTGAAHKLAEGLRVDQPCLSRDGSRVAFVVQPEDPAQGPPKLGLLEVECGTPVELHPRGAPMDWSADGRQLLVGGGPGPGAGTVVLWAPASGRSASILADPVTGHSIFHAAFSPDNRWIAFYVLEPQRRALYITPFHGFDPCPQSEWISLSEERGSDAYPRWSPDGNLLYFLSDRDGHRCIWAQRLDASKHSSGEPFDVYHLHGPRLSMDNLENHAAIGLRVHRDSLILALGERRGSLWMFFLREGADPPL